MCLLINPTATNSNILLPASEIHCLKNAIAFSLRLCVSLLINPTAATTYNNSLITARELHSEKRYSFFSQTMSYRPDITVIVDWA